MSRRLQLPDPDGPDGARRVVAEITRLLGEMDARLEVLERANRIETDIARAPVRPGAIAVVGTTVYIATGRSSADWLQVSP